MPEFGVIVHGPDTQGHLAGLLDPLAAVPLPGFEVVVAAVGDRTRETAEARALPGTLVLPLPDGTDDTAARAAGVTPASGRRLHFVHAKDGLPPGTPRTIAEHAHIRPRPKPPGRPPPGRPPPVPRQTPPDHPASPPSTRASSRATSAWTCRGPSSPCTASQAYATPGSASTTGATRPTQPSSWPPHLPRAETRAAYKSAGSRWT